MAEPVGSFPGPDAIPDTYRRQAMRWDTDRARSFFEKGWLLRATEGLAPGAQALDLGCGAGEPIASWLIAQGYALTGADVADEMLALARDRFPQAEWIRADMRTLSLGRQFDLIVAWDSFFHLSPAAQRQMFPIFARHLSPGGRLLFTSGPAAGEAWGRVGEEAVYHASLAAGEYASLLTDNGLNLRGYLAEDADCDRHSVWLAQRGF
ncbi:class I SAM-dependent DNA methyltransferase [Acidimangrovimonas sediminis]|uniref:class I SAM-dependent DNA methyltransferase n=1 Tax=Acidimangrovimonas sediminis TaxID=2056283 RepID=UPI000C7FF571|nr:class I SAM-dependent methyltransferase [Acidimangrovimonas sediminis]